VIHSFWADQLGVKADANPGYDNIAYTTTKGPLHFNVHCVELCGIWHGYMYSRGTVVPQSQFASWIAGQQHEYGTTNQGLGPYSPSYNPAPQRRGG
jgi:cytochrome c oxidase subunit 2